MAKILVAGGLYPEEENPKLREALQRFSRSLGRELIARGHVVLGGCSSTLDAAVAEGAEEMAIERKLNPKQFIRSWVTSTTKPAHDKGEVTRSRVPDWSQVPRGYYTFPEPIREAAVVIIVGGSDGTHYAASWARIANKPIVPVAAFGLAAEEIFEEEQRDFDRRYGDRLPYSDYDALNRVLPDDVTPQIAQSFARDVVLLAEKLIVSTEAFIIMSFAEKGHLQDAYDTFVQVCDDNHFRGFKVDDHIDTNQRIVSTVLESIRRSAFIIADVSEPRPNVYYELGYAQALGKSIITTAYAGTQLPFDIFDVPTLYWDNQRTLRQELDRRIKLIRKS
ncbi:MAG TPA: hypothetical protein VGG06_13425 [Thermoanaerobaculia bacterium]|jgi:hypothetical protein